MSSNGKKTPADPVATDGGSTATLTRKDFESDQDVRWCPGCGDYAILRGFQNVFPKIGVKRENIVVVSGIGCAARFPYYVNSYGFHTIHGRAPAIATGLKIANPELSVWVVTGDGDALSIGGNHLIHTLRRNVGIKIVLFNNRIYGLTKGQYSPTSEIGKHTKSTPFGSIDHPFNPLSLAIGAEATFVARTVDVYSQHMAEMLEKAASHEGTAFVEIYQNCNIFNNGAFDTLRHKQVRDDNTIQLEHGKPILFGAEASKGLVLKGGTPRVVQVADVDDKDLLVHDAHSDDPTLAFMLSRLETMGLPTPVGVLRDVQRPVYDASLHEQVQKVTAQRGEGTLEALLDTGDTWTV
jgi:2-oxoglutarate ferredoxin oxidoreductase subunit beta